MRTFAGVNILPYKGAPYKASAFIGNCPVSLVPILIDWSLYGVSSSLTSIGVNVSLIGQGATAAIIPRMTSVYIDNTQSNVPVFLKFIDTGQVIPCQPFSSGWFQCLTNGVSAIIFGVGFVTGQIPVTQLHFTDAYVAPFNSLEISQSRVLEKASRSITRGTTIYNQDYAVPAIGDQTTQTQLYVGVANTANVMNTPYVAPYNYLYLTNLTVTTVRVEDATARQFEFFLESTGSAGILYDWILWCPSGSQENVNLYQQSGMNIKLDATQTWRVRNTQSMRNGFINFIFTFSINPE